jgi:hypothetical protein
MCREAGLKDVRIEKDLAGRDRVVLASRSGGPPPDRRKKTLGETGATR